MPSGRCPSAICRGSVEAPSGRAVRTNPTGCPSAICRGSVEGSVRRRCWTARRSYPSAFAGVTLRTPQTVDAKELLRRDQPPRAQRQAGHRPCEDAARNPGGRHRQSGLCARRDRRGRQGAWPETVGRKHGDQAAVGATDPAASGMRLLQFRQSQGFVSHRLTLDVLLR